MICTYRGKTGNAEISDKKTTMARTHLEGGQLVSNTTKGRSPATTFENVVSSCTALLEKV